MNGVGTGKDYRPWRTYTLRLPEDVALQFEEAKALARAAGAKDEIECIEAIAVHFVQDHTLTLLRQMADSAEDHYRLNAIFVSILCGWRCVKCETSRHLTTHHLVARSAGGSDDPENLVPLCVTCHDLVQPQWRGHIEELKCQKQKAMDDVKQYGFVQTAKHVAGRKVRWA